MKLVTQNITTGSWELEKVFGETEPGKLSSAEGMTVTPTGMIAIADHDVARIQVYSATGQHKLSIDTTQGLMPGTRSWPWNVAVSLDGSYYVTDETRFIKVYDSSGVFKVKWVAVSPENKPSDDEDTALRGLTIDSKSQVLVGEVRHKYVSIHKLSGLHITSIKVNIMPWSLAVTSQDTIIVSDCWNVVQIVDIKGQHLHTLKPPSQVARWSPWGIYCYKDIILICNNSSPSRGVYCFSPSGDYLRCIGTRDSPRCVTVWNSKLYLACGSRGDIYSCR